MKPSDTVDNTVVTALLLYNKTYNMKPSDTVSNIVTALLQ